MDRLISLLTIALCALLFSARTNAQSNLCELFGGSELQCQICGYTPSSPVYCVAYNATFDDLPSGEAIPIYKNTAWPGFTPLAQSSLIPRSNSKSMSILQRIRTLIQRHISSDRRSLLDTTLSPPSPPNYATLPPNTVGSMIFGEDGGADSVATNGQLPSGSLHYFAYACAVANTNPPLATACNITVSGTCLAAGAGDIVNGPFAQMAVTLEYSPGEGGDGDGSGMAYQSVDFALLPTAGGAVAAPQKCANYSFEAVGMLDASFVGQEGGLALDDVVLLLDDVVFNTYARGNRR